jgi:hypothetical protein
MRFSFATLVLGSLAGCSSILGIDGYSIGQPSTDMAEAGAGASGPDAETNSHLSDAQTELLDSGEEPDFRDSDVSVIDGDALVDSTQPSEPEAKDASVPCTDMKPDREAGIFVSTAGSREANCGAYNLPCSSRMGCDKRRPQAVSLVYIATGEYSPDRLKLLPGLTLQGGWTHLADDWTRKCGVERASITVVASTSNVGIYAEYDGESVLDTLTVRTKPTAADGESQYAIWVQGASTRLMLKDVIASAGPSGKGAAGRGGAAAASVTGTCTPSTGKAGLSGMTGKGGAKGAFDATGYLPMAGLSGTSGSPGQAGLTMAPECLHGCAIGCVMPAQNICVASATGDICGVAGLTGCGGMPGLGGEGGQGGGSSIGLFAAGGLVTISGGSLASADGAPGGRGGAGGQGSIGSEGKMGANGQRCGPCINGSSCAPPPNTPQPKGSTGGTGGRGGTGGNGGDGAVGSSFAYYKAVAASIMVSPLTQLHHGGPGPIVGNGAAGDALDTNLQQ